jgi:hypothetical protein
MRAARALRPSMLRGILQAIAVFFFLRLVFSVLRLLTAGSRPEADPTRTSGREGVVPRRKAMRVDPSNVTDVPFPEIPAGGDAPRVDTEAAKRVEAR